MPFIYRKNYFVVKLIVQDLNL